MQLDTMDEYINGLWYGDGGTGKTTDLASMANLGKIVYVNAESGLKARPLKALGIQTENITVWPNPAKGEKITFESMEALHLSLLKQLTDEKTKEPIVGLVIDSITEVYKQLLDNVVAASVIRQRNAGKDREQFSIELKDYGYMTEQVRMLVRRFRDLPCHFAMSALSRREQDDDGSVTYQPAITPALQNDLVGWVDIVCATQPVTLIGSKEQYLGLFRPHNKYRGKDRLGVMPRYLVDPTFERVVQFAQGDLTRDNDPITLAAKEAAEKLAETATAAA